MNFKDGLKSLINSLSNRRDPVYANRIKTTRLDDLELREIYKTGLGSKIVRLKAGYALNGTLEFQTEKSKLQWEHYCQRQVNRATRFMLAFGRGIIVIVEKGADLSKPKKGPIDLANAKLVVFSGDMVSVPYVNRDLTSPRYYEPEMYTVRGMQFHHSRVIDFSYHEPAEQDKPTYKYGGVSEFELVYGQLINDATVERASAAILDKSSQKIIKVKGFKEQLQSGNADSLLSFFSTMEDSAGIFGASIIDAEDEVVNFTHQLSNLGEADQITLRRLAMVTGIPMAILVGENVKGLNSSGKIESEAFQDMLQSVQYDYLIEPIKLLARRLGIPEPKFAQNQGGDPEQAVQFESNVLQNAITMNELGLDYESYLKEKGFQIDMQVDIENFFAPPTDDDEPQPEQPEVEDSEQSDPMKMLTGNQVQSILNVKKEVQAGDIDKSAAAAILEAGYGITGQQADRILQSGKNADISILQNQDK